MCEYVFLDLDNFLSILRYFFINIYHCLLDNVKLFLKQKVLKRKLESK